MSTLQHVILVVFLIVFVLFMLALVAASFSVHSYHKPQIDDDEPYNYDYDDDEPTNQPEEG